MLIFCYRILTEYMPSAHTHTQITKFSSETDQFNYIGVLFASSIHTELMKSCRCSHHFNFPYFLSDFYKESVVYARVCFLSVRFCLICCFILWTAEEAVVKNINGKIAQNFAHTDDDMYIGNRKKLISMNNCNVYFSIMWDVGMKYFRANCCHTHKHTQDSFVPKWFIFAFESR